MTNHVKQIDAIVIKDINLSEVADGTYMGDHSVLPVIVEAKVTVKDHRITEIILTKHINGQGKPAEILPGKVVESQSLKVDTVTGATSSSKVILKAIQNALEKGMQGNE
ncbi:MAG: FMN-binding protein [Eubacteriaceae bacterium]|nr:FMN-binding protein [Eubacteriaceae bacterium]